MNTEGCRIDFSALSAAGLDLKAADERFAGMGQLYEKCLLLYFRSDNITRLEELAAAADWQGVYNCAHTLKGSAGNLALVPLFDIYVKICAGAESRSTAEIPELLAQARRYEDTFRRAVGCSDIPGNAS